MSHAANGAYSGGELAIGAGRCCREFERPGWSDAGVICCEMGTQRDSEVTSYCSHEQYLNHVKYHRNIKRNTIIRLYRRWEVVKAALLYLRPRAS